MTCVDQDFQVLDGLLVTNKAFFKITIKSLILVKTFFAPNFFALGFAAKTVCNSLKK